MNKLLLLAAVVILIAGCSKKDNITPKTQPVVTGQWYYTLDSAKLYQNGKLVQTYGLAFDHVASIIFRPDGTGTQYDPGHVLYYFTYVISGANITLNYQAQSISNLSLPHPVSETAAFKIITDTKLVLNFDESYVDSNGINTRVTEEIDFGK
ncbi:MAG TPA: hypothetical protein VK668_04810 [Mucilaginibacter sp.]|nr:hypothetical protein [Mucilaginibacter sp.]